MNFSVGLYIDVRYAINNLFHWCFKDQTEFESTSDTIALQRPSNLAVMYLARLFRIQEAVFSNLD
jgi:hypothetical protein